MLNLTDLVTWLAQNGWWVVIGLLFGVLYLAQLVGDRHAR
jgi:hypothetical protein